MIATIENLPIFSSTQTMQTTLPAAQTNSIISARMRRMSQLPAKRPTMKKPKATVSMMLAMLSFIHPCPVTKLMK